MGRIKMTDTLVREGKQINHDKSSTNITVPACTKQLNYIVNLVAIYITFKILIFTLGDETILVNNFHIATGSLFIPLWFFTGDIITELYGFKFIKRLLLIAIGCQFFFAIACYLTTMMPMIQIESINLAYNLVFQRMPRLAFSSLLALVFGALVNAYFLDRWKQIVNGRYFLIRSLSTTLISEVLFSFIAIYSQFAGQTSFVHILEMLLASISIKFFVSLIAAYPVSIIANYIKYKTENETATLIPDIYKLYEDSASTNDK